MVVNLSQNIQGEVFVRYFSVNLSLQIDFRMVMLTVARHTLALCVAITAIIVAVFNSACE